MPKDTDPKQPMDQGIIARITGAYRVLTGQSTAMDQAWFGPLNPIPPVVPQEQIESVVGRQFDYPAGYNMRLRPRSTDAVSFEQMRALADNCDVLRCVIETRKDQIGRMQWSIGKVNDDAGTDDRCKMVEEFFKLPDGEHTFNEWLRMILEDMFVTDATTIYPWMKNDNTPYRFDLIDGSTIKRVIDEHGRTPAPPYPAYQQVLKGVIASDYTSDELVYMPRNPRTHKIYGYSPVEQIILTVNVAIRRAIYQLQYYTEGSTPDLIFSTPVNWNNKQIQEFMDFWNMQLSGQTGQRRQTMFVPGGIQTVDTKSAILKDEYDEWLARVICYCFSVSPQPFIKQQNRSTADNAHQMANEEGLYPIMFWVKNLIDKLIWRYFGFKDIEFKWGDQNATDPVDQSQIDDRNVRNGTATINEIRASRGEAPVDGGDVAMCMTATGYVPITPAAQPDPTEQDPNDGAKPKSGENEPPQGTGQVMDENQAAKYLGATLKKKSSKKLVQPINRNDQKHHEQLNEFTQAILDQLSKLADELVKQVQHSRTKVVKSAKDENKNKGDEAEAAELSTLSLEWDGWDNFDTIFTTHLTDIVQSGVEDAYAQIDIQDTKTLELANKEAIKYAHQRAAELVGKKIAANGALVDNENSEYSIEDSTREMVRATVVEGLEQGLSNDDLAASLKGAYAFSSARASTIARTETAKAEVQGNLVLYKQSGEVVGKSWLTAAGCCDECQELDGEEVPIDADFSNGDDGPPAHPNCRCDIIPVLSDDADETADQEGE